METWFSSVSFSKKGIKEEEFFSFNFVFVEV
jgi:hypothetical protein